LTDAYRIDIYRQSDHPQAQWKAEMSRARKETSKDVKPPGGMIQRSILIRQAAKPLYELIQNVAEYPEFLRACRRSEIVRSRGETQHVDHIIRYIKEFRIVLVYWFYPWDRVQWEQREGPFRELRGGWRLRDGGQQSFTELSGRLIVKPSLPVPGRIVDFIASHFLDRLLIDIRNRAEQL